MPRDGSPRLTPSGSALAALALSDARSPRSSMRASLTVAADARPWASSRGASPRAGSRSSVSTPRAGSKSASPHPLGRRTTVSKTISEAQLEPEPPSEFEDEELMDSMLKSLISSQGLQKSSQMVRKRLESLEKGLGKVQDAIDTRHFVFRDEFTEVVETRHASELEKHAGMLADLADAQQKQSTVVQVQEQIRLDSAEKTQERFDAMAAEVSALKQADKDLREMTEHSVQSVNDRIQTASADIDARLAALEMASRAQQHELEDRQKAQEERYKLWLVGEIKNMIAQFMDGDHDDDTDEEDDIEVQEGGAEHHAFTEGDHWDPSTPSVGRAFTTPLLAGEGDAGGSPPRSPSSRIASKRPAILMLPEGNDVSGVGSMASSKGFSKKTVEKALESLRSHFDRTSSQLAERLLKQGGDLRRQIRVVEKSLDSFKGSSSNNMEEVREELRDCLKKGEAAKIEKTLSGNMGELWNEFSSLRHTAVGKLNEFVGHFAKVHEAIDDHEHCLRHHAEEIENRSTKYDVLACQRLIDATANKKEFLRETNELREMLEWQGNKIEGFGLMGATRFNKSFRPTMSSSMPEDNEQNTRIGEDNAGGIVRQDGDAFNRAADRCELLTEQLNALAMGVVWLAHLQLLQEPKDGYSRNQRITQERDLLEELRSVRHWITHNRSPAGWDTCKLTTAALECSHHQEATSRVPHPMPVAKQPSPPAPSAKGKKQPKSARQARRETPKVLSGQPAVPNSARLTKEGLGSANTASLSTLATVGDLHSNKTSMERLPRYQPESSPDAGDQPKASSTSPASSIPSLPPLAAATARVLITSQ